MIFEWLKNIFFKKKKEVITSVDCRLFDVSYSHPWKEARAELNQYQSWEKAWDGYDAEIFSNEVLSMAHQILDWSEEMSALKKAGNMHNLTITPGPAVDGSIDLEFRFGFSRHLFFTIYKDEVIIQSIVPHTDIISIPISSFTKDMAEESLRDMCEQVSKEAPNILGLLEGKEY